MNAKRQHWDLQGKQPYIQSYCGALDLVNGFDQSGTFAAQLKFESLFYEKVIVPDSFLHCYGPISSTILGSRNEESRLVIDFLKRGILVPALRVGDSLLDNWKSGVEGIVPGALVIRKSAKGAKILETIEAHTSFYANWPKDVNDAMPEYRIALRELFVGGIRPALVTREGLCKYLGLDGVPTRGWHGLLEVFREAIVRQEAKENFRRAELEKAIGLHFGFKGFTKIYEFTCTSAVNRANPRWQEIIVARFLLQATATVYEAYQAKRFNSVGNLFGKFITPIANASFASQLGEMHWGRPGSRGAVVPAMPPCLDPAKLSIGKIARFRDSALFKDQYLTFLRSLEPTTPTESFVDVNHAFYRFLNDKYLPKIIAEFPDAFDPHRIKAVGSNVKFWAEFCDEPTAQMLVILLFGIPIISLVKKGGATLEKYPDKIAHYMSKWEKAKELRAARNKLNGFIKEELQAARRKQDKA